MGKTWGDDHEQVPGDDGDDGHADDDHDIGMACDEQGAHEDKKGNDMYQMPMAPRLPAP